MSRPDWRSTDSYRPALNYDAAAFAWEYLRRNLEYRADYAKSVEVSSLETTGIVDMRKRWGVCFRARP